MILKLFLIHTSYIILTITGVNMYVLFAENSDDFRNIAKKIIPVRLADQLADMASKTIITNPDLNEKEGEYTDSKDGLSVDTEYDYGTDIELEAKNPNKRFIVKDQQAKVDVDLDELVKRVKEKLENDYSLSTTSKNDPNSKSKKSDDYYYKDDLNEEITSKVRQPTKTLLPVFANNAQDTNAANNFRQYQGRNNGPQYQAEDNAQQYQNADNAPRYQSKDNAPQYEAEDNAQRYEAKDNAPKYEAEDNAQQYQTKDNAPQYEAEDNAQQYQTKDNVPQYEAEDNAQQYQTKDNAPQYEAEDNAQRYQAKDNAPQYQDAYNPLRYQAKDNAPQHQAENNAQRYQAKDNAPRQQAENNAQRYQAKDNAPRHQIEDNPQQYPDADNDPQYEDDYGTEDMYAEENGNIKNIDVVNKREPKYKNEITNTKIKYPEYQDTLSDTHMQDQRHENSIKKSILPVPGSKKTTWNTNMQVPKYENRISNTNLNANNVHVGQGNKVIEESVTTLTNKKYKNKKNVYVPVQYFEQDPELNKNVNIVNDNKENGNDDDYYEEAPDNTDKPSGKVFKEWDMNIPSNDSYEDYVIPEKDENPSTKKHIKQLSHILKLASADNKHKLNRPKAIADPIKKKDVKKVSLSTKITPITPEIKGKTENLWYKEPNIDNYDDSTRSTTMDPSGTTKKKRINTMFPTRAHFKMSSPNYLAMIPAVAEKYNFNEPIPEKDREPENIHRIGNPSALINKKVKLS